MTELNLSDEVYEASAFSEETLVIGKYTVKQFIKLNNRLVRGLIAKKLTVSEYWEKHDKLIGEKLK